jgi:hypothetical protein
MTSLSLSDDLAVQLIIEKEVPGEGISGIKPSAEGGLFSKFLSTYGALISATIIPPTKLMRAACTGGSSRDLIKI